MRGIGIACVLVVVGCGGGKGRDKVCERWVAMIQKCSSDQKPFDAASEKESCVGIESGPDPWFQKQHDCAASTEDCETFGKCVDAATAEHVKAPAAQAAQATELTLEILRASMAAIKGVTDCDPQTAKVTAALQPLATKSSELKGLVKDAAVSDAVSRSDRVRGAVEALKKASACSPVLDAAQKAIH
jgi:hypothetical protein